MFHPVGRAAILSETSLPGGFTINVDTGVHQIITDGASEAIKAISVNGDITVRSNGNILLTGEGVNFFVDATPAISVTGSIADDDSVTVISTSDIRTIASVSDAINVRGGGDISVIHDGTIHTQGIGAAAIRATASYGATIDILNTGTIVTEEGDNINADLIGIGEIIINNESDLTTGGHHIIAEAIGYDNGEEIDTRISITSTGNLGFFSSRDDAGGIKANIERNGDIDITVLGSIEVNHESDSAISAIVQGTSGAVDIRSTANLNVIFNDFDGVTGSGILAQSGSVDGTTNVTSFGNIFTATRSAIDASGALSTTVSSTGNLDARPFLPSIFSESIGGALSASAADRVEVTSVGDINVRSGRFAGFDDVIGGVAILAEAGRQEIQNVVAQVDIASTGHLSVAAGNSRRDSLELPVGGILAKLDGPADVTITSVGNITSEAANNAAGIAAIYLERAISQAVSSPTGTVMITSTGDISMMGDISDAVRVKNGSNSTSTVSLLGGNVTGGTGTSAGVSFLSDDSSAVGTLNLQAGRLSAISGVAVRGLAGNETINNSGTVAGSILLGGGTNAFNNLAGARLDAGPSVDLGGGILRNVGTFSPLASGVVGVITLTGDLVLEAAGTLFVDVESGGGSDRVNVAGQTTLAGTLIVNGLGLLTAFSDGDDFVVIDSASEMTGAFANVQDNIPDLAVQVRIADGGDGGDEVRLTLVAGIIDPPVEPVDPPVEPVDPPVEPVDPPVEPVDPPVEPVDPPVEPETPETSDKTIVPNTAQAVALMASGFASDLRNRARMDGLSGSGPSVTRLSFSGLLAEPRISTRNAHTARNFASWASLSGRHASVDGGYDSHWYGLSSGITFAPDETFRWGFGVGALQGDVSDGASVSDIDTLNAGLYAAWNEGLWSVSGAVVAGRQDYDITRPITLGDGNSILARGDTSGTSVAASVAVSYDMARANGWGSAQNLSFAPMLSFDTARVSVNGYTETGAGVLNQTYAKTTYSSAHVGLGFTVSQQFQQRDGSLVTPFGSIAYRHSVGDRNASTSSTIGDVAGANFTTTGVLQPEDTLAVEFGFNVRTTKKFDVNVRYRGDFSNGSKNQAVNLSATWKF